MLKMPGKQNRLHLVAAAFIVLLCVAVLVATWWLWLIGTDAVAPDTDVQPSALPNQGSTQPIQVPSQPLSEVDKKAVSEKPPRSQASNQTQQHWSWMEVDPDAALADIKQQADAAIAEVEQLLVTAEASQSKDPTMSVNAHRNIGSQSQVVTVSQERLVIEQEITKLKSRIEQLGNGGK